MFPMIESISAKLRTDEKDRFCFVEGMCYRPLAIVIVDLYVIKPLKVFEVVEELPRARRPHAQGISGTAPAAPRLASLLTWGRYPS